MVLQLANVHSRTISDPIDLGLVSRRVKAREYGSGRAVLDAVCSVFDQSLEVLSQPVVSDSYVPTSIIFHLKDYVIMMWQEYMLPSDPPLASDSTSPLFDERELSRKERLQNSGRLPFTLKMIDYFRKKLDDFTASCGLLDGMDSESLSEMYGAIELEATLKRLGATLFKLTTQRHPDYTMDSFYRDLLSCIPESSQHHQRINNRLSRFFWKLVTPLHEAHTRGVGPSSVWGDVVTTIWARDGPRKPYWPSICLGVLAPEADREDWHAAITKRNEARLPQGIAEPLSSARENCERAVQKHSDAYFLVEFLGVHEFGWVSCMNVVEFDSDDDPNRDLAPSYFGKRYKQLLPTALDEIATVAEQYAQTLDTVYDWK